MLGEATRGYILELLLTKICYLIKEKGLMIQIIGMSATCPNLEDISSWLGTKLYITHFRPVPLIEKIYFESNLYNVHDMTPLIFPQYFFSFKVRDPVLPLTLETVLEGNGVLIFCSSKSKCEDLAKKLASFFNLILYKSKKQREEVEIQNRFKKVILESNHKVLLEQLARSPAALEPLFEKIIPYGVAFHHAGLSLDERDIVEDGFRRGILKVLVATSTLSSGVNLPARRVIIASPKFYNQVMDVISYKQMIGRAGRKGIDSEGESILICDDNHSQDGQSLAQASLRKIESRILFNHVTLNNEISISDNIKRAVLEVFANRICSTFEEVKKFLNKTFYACLGEIKNELIQETIKYLTDFKFLTFVDRELKYIPTKLGKAVLSSSISPDDALYYVRELEKARKGFVLQNDLHIIYEITLPLANRSSVDWKKYFDIWNELDSDSQHVGHVIGLDPRFIQKRSIQDSRCKDVRTKSHIRFYYALALNDLVQEMPLYKVSEKYNLTKGELQQMQIMASTFAAIISIFCQKLGYNNLELIISQYQDRLQFGVQRELIDLMRISTLTAQLARDLFKAGFNTVVKLAHSNVNTLASVLKDSVPFSMNQCSNQERKIWISGQYRAMDNKEIAQTIITEARVLIEKDIGTKICWGIDETHELFTYDDTELDKLNSSQMKSFKSKRLKRSSGTQNQSVTSFLNLNSKRPNFKETLIVEDNVMADEKLNEDNNVREAQTDTEMNVSKNTKRNKSSSPEPEQTHKTKKIDQNLQPSSSSCQNSSVEDKRTNNFFEYINCSGIKLKEVQDENHVTLIIDQLKSTKKMFIIFDLKRLKPSSLTQKDDLSTEAVFGGLKFSYNKVYSLQEIAITFGNQEVYQILSPFALSLFRAEFKSALKSEKIHLITYDLNSAFKVFRKCFEIKKKDLDRVEWFDLKSAAWLLDPDKEEPNCCASLIKTVLEKEILIDDYSELLKNYATCWSAYYSVSTFIKLDHSLSEQALSKYFAECEMKVIMIISEMELNGFGVDVGYLKSSIQEWTDLKERLYLQAVKLAGKEFNLDSPKQISNILYRDLNLLSHCTLLVSRSKSPLGKRRIPEHLKTSKRMLNILKKYHPFPELIINMRHLSFVIEKATSILTHAMRVENYKMERVSGISNHWTSTGRILMQSPNLLHIARDCVMSFQNKNYDVSLRKAFKARDGYLLISADYCQLELRILAHFSKDENLLYALNQDEDVFVCIARQLKGDQDGQEISEEERRQAKEVSNQLVQN